MNYQAGASLGCACGQPLIDSTNLPIGDKWQRVSFALAGYGHVVPGSISDAAPVSATNSLAETCEASSSIIRRCNASSSIEVV